MSPPTTTTLPKERITVRFPPAAHVDESYQLLELPPEILKVVEAGDVVPLTIKGRPNDDAVLCTADRTYALRTVAISNSLMILRPPATADHPTLQIRDVCHEVLECQPAPARVERLRGVLRESAWKGLGSEDDETAALGLGKRKRALGDSGEGSERVKRYTLAQLQSIIQASDAELVAAVREANAIEVDGHMLLLPPEPLRELLSLLLPLIALHSGAIESLPEGHTDPECEAADILCGLSSFVEPHLATAVMRHFGVVNASDMWAADVRRMVGELGRGLLVELKDAREPLERFLTRWRDAAGDLWNPHVELSYLSGFYLLDTPEPGTIGAGTGPHIRYFAYHSLPSHVATRFADLFLTRPRWRPEDMTPFLRGLYPAYDSKAKDKLVAKYVRVVKDKDGAWWYPRRT